MSHGTGAGDGYRAVPANSINPGSTQHSVLRSGGGGVSAVARSIPLATLGGQLG